jgi:hypothetical protein
MTTKNDITGDSIRSKLSNDKYAKGWDRIFNQKTITHKCKHNGIVVIKENTMCPWCNKVCTNKDNVI